MAFEIFDDVAFYWFLQVLLAALIIPLTWMRLKSWCKRTKKIKTKNHPHVDNIPDYIPSQTLLSEKSETIESKLSLSNIFFAGLWVLFLLLMIQLPRWHNSALTDFDPYAILGIEKGASAAEIKRAYRKQSLLNHPDRCIEDDPQICNDKFILITKAHKALTDEATKENYEKFGNPDGYQGTSVTIGLPKWLTDKNNELIILSVYFIFLILLVAIVGGWWSHSSKFHKSGVYKQSIDIYWRFVKQNMRMRHLLDILAASAEFKILDHKIPEDTTNAKFKQLKILEDQIIQFLKKKVPKGQNPRLDTLFKASYVRRSSSLLNAHLIGLPIPNELKEDYLFVLQEAPRLIDVMIDMTLSRERFWAQGLQLIQMKQAIIQGVWPFESNLKQLPYWTEGVDNALKKKKFKTVTDLNFCKPETLREVLTDAYKNYSSDFSYLISGSSSNNDDSNKLDDTEEDLSKYPENIRKIKEKQRENKRNQELKRQQYKGNNSNNNNNKNNNKDNNNSNNNNTNNNNSNKNKAKESKNDEIEYAPGSIDSSDQDVEQMVKDAEAMVRMFPVVKMNWCARTYDEKSVCVGDIVKVTVYLKRIKQPWEFTVETFKSVEEIDPPELESKRKRQKSKNKKNKKNKNKNKKNRNKNQNNTAENETTAASGSSSEETDKTTNDENDESAAGSVSDNDENENEADGDGNDENEENGDSDNDEASFTNEFEPTDYDEDHALGFVENELDEDKRLQIIRDSAPVVHVNRFPFRVKEKWMILLVDHAVPAVVDQRAIPALVKTKKVDLHFRINRPPGRYKYLLFARCDSYLGCDRHMEFILDVKAPEKVRSSNDDDPNAKEGTPELDYQIPDEEEYEAEPKWYYLWNSTFWEFLLTLFLLYFIYLVLVSTSFGKKWIQPYVEMFFDYCIYPVTDLANEKLSIVLFNPLCKQILKLTGFDLRAWWLDLDEDEMDDDFDFNQGQAHTEM